MIIKSFETHKIDLNTNQFLLLYGKNEGFKNQIKISLLKDKTITSNYDEIEIINEPNKFFQNISSKSLFETEKIIFINRATDKIFKIISELIEKKFENLIPDQKIRPIIGGILLGILAFIPFGIGLEILGNGYSAMQKALTSEYTLLIAISILLLKPIATSITLSSGWPGGIFAPAIFLGAFCGYLFGFGVENLFYKDLIDPGSLSSSYSIVGMGTFLAAMTQAPLTSIFFTFELTQTYQAVLPVMISSVIGTSIYRLIIGRSFESCYFKKDNIEIVQNEESNILNNMKVSEIMRRDVVTIPEKMTLGKFIEFLPTTQLTTFPLIDENDNLSGIISVQDYRGWVLEEELKDVVIMKDLASTQVNTVTPEESMLEVLRHWDKGDMLPVVSKDGSKKIIGILARRDALIAYNKALNEDNN